MRKMLLTKLHQRSLIIIHLIDKCDQKIDYYKSIDAVNNMMESLPFYVRIFTNVSLFIASHVFASQKKKSKRKKVIKPADVKREIQRMGAIKSRLIKSYLSTAYKLNNQLDTCEEEMHKSTNDTIEIISK